MFPRHLDDDESKDNDGKCGEDYMPVDAAVDVAHFDDSPAAHRE